MSTLHLLRIPLQTPRLLRFATDHGIAQEDDTLGYTLHAWFAALFGSAAPKPFRYFEHRAEVLAYANADSTALLEQAQAYASPQAWAALDVDGVASKPMPLNWRVGQSFRLEVLTCPVSRKGDVEKDVFLRTLDRLGDDAPPRAEVYHNWLIAQLGTAVRVDQTELLGMSARVRLLRRARNGGNRLRIFERPQALFGVDAVITDPERFRDLLVRGVGRHRAFGFGMLLLSPLR